MTNKAKAEFYKNEYMAQFGINKNLLAEIERLKETIDGQDVEIMRLKDEIEHQKAIAEAELDSIHKLGDDYEKVLEDELKHIRWAKVEAVKEVGKLLIDKCHDGIICAVDVLDIVVDYMNGECETDER